MSAVDDGGPAFPCEREVTTYDPYRNPNGTAKVHMPGMSLLDYLAGQAAQGLLAACANPDCFAMVLDEARKAGLSFNEQVAVDAYNKAEHMLAEKRRRGDGRG